MRSGDEADRNGAARQPACRTGPGRQRVAAAAGRSRCSGLIMTVRPQSLCDRNDPDDPK